jgi:hypothetical protein
VGVGLGTFVKLLVVVCHLLFSKMIHSVHLLIVKCLFRGFVLS